MDLHKADPDTAFIVLNHSDAVKDCSDGLWDNSARPAPGFILRAHREGFPTPYRKPREEISVRRKPKQTKHPVRACIS